MLDYLRNFPRDTSGLTLFFLNVVLGALGYYVANIVFTSKWEGKTLVAPEFAQFCSIIASMLAFVVLYIWAYGRKVQFEFAGFSERLQAMENGEHAIEGVGTALELLDDRFRDLMEAASKATSVRNTLIFYHATNATRLEASLNAYLKKGAAARYQVISSVVDDGREWIELFSQNVSRRLNTHIQATKAASANLYKPFVLRKGWPVVNFVLFDGTEPEVWFGFGLFTSDVNGDVFRSRDRDLFIYFERYFEELQRGCVEWTGVELESFQGTWITVVYKGSRIKDCGLVVISTHAGATDINGEVFPLDELTGRLDYRHSFGADNIKCVLDDDRVKLEFDCINDGNVPLAKREVRCCYEIRDFRSPSKLAGALRPGTPDPIRIQGRRLTEAGAASVAALSPAEKADYLTGLANAGNIRRQPTPGNRSPFSGTMFE